MESKYLFDYTEFMYELLDSHNLQSLAYQFTDDEADTIIFASKIYHQNLVHGRIEEQETESSYIDILCATEVLEANIQELHHGSRVFLPEIRNFLVTSVLGYLCRQFDNINDGETLDSICFIFDVDVDEFVLRAIKAHRILDEEDTQYRLL
jgi:hypothetical protein